MPETNAWEDKKRCECILLYEIKFYSTTYLFDILPNKTMHSKFITYNTLKMYKLQTKHLIFKAMKTFYRTQTFNGY